MEKVLDEELWLFWMVCANPTLRLPLEGVPPLRVPNPGAPCAPLCPSGTLLLFPGPIRSVLVTVTGLGQEGAHATDVGGFALPLLHNGRWGAQATDGKRFHARTPLFVLPSHIARYLSVPRERQALTE